SSSVCFCKGSLPSKILSRRGVGSLRRAERGRNHTEYSQVEELLCWLGHDCSSLSLHSQSDAYIGESASIVRPIAGYDFAKVRGQPARWVDRDLAGSA